MLQWISSAAKRSSLNVTTKKAEETTPATANTTSESASSDAEPTLLSVEPNVAETSTVTSVDASSVSDVAPASKPTATASTPNLVSNRGHEGQSSSSALPAKNPWRISWRAVAPFPSKDAHRASHKPALSAVQEHEKKLVAAEEHIVAEVKASRSEKRAKKSAWIVRSLIVGSPGAAPKDKPKVVPKAKVEKVKSELMNPKSANRLIAQLRALPSSDSADVPSKEKPSVTTPAGPIHAVCLAYTDAEAHERFFSRLAENPDGLPDEPVEEITLQRTLSIQSAVVQIASITTASIAQLTSLFSELHVVDLITSPGLGLGQSADKPGVLAGAIPSAEAVIEGVQEITPQLMALGYATGKAILPDHSSTCCCTYRIPRSLSA